MTRRAKKKLRAARAAGLYGVRYALCCKTCQVRRWYLTTETGTWVYTTKEVAALPRAQRTALSRRRKVS